MYQVNVGVFLDFALNPLPFTVNNEGRLPCNNISNFKNWNCNCNIDILYAAWRTGAKITYIPFGFYPRYKLSSKRGLNFHQINKLYRINSVSVTFQRLSTVCTEAAIK